MSIEAESREKKYRKNSRHQQYGASMDATSVGAMIRLCYLACHRLQKVRNDAWMVAWMDDDG